jgi:caffeoyl-CoA O-methyltransferase
MELDMKQDLIPQDIEAYAACYSRPESELLAQISADSKNMTGAQMLSGPLVAGLLRLLIKLSHAKTVLDIGTFSGYSALSMAEALPENAKLITIESSAATLNLAKSYFEKSLHHSKIETYLGNALEVLPKLTETFDLIFIDADKNKILEYYELALSKLRSGGIMLIDDVLWRGEVLEAEPVDKRARAMHSLNKHIVQDSRVENLLLPIRHGLNLLIKS